jgi:hypothetical protein
MAAVNQAIFYAVDSPGVHTLFRKIDQSVCILHNLFPSFACVNGNYKFVCCTLYGQMFYSFGLEDH